MRPPRFFLAPVALATLLAFTGAPVHAQDMPASMQVSLSAMPLGQALNELARQASLQMSFPADAVAGKTAPAVTGRLTVRQALNRLLAGSGLQARISGDIIIVSQAAQDSQVSTLPAVSVIGEADPVAERVNPPLTIGSKIPVAQREIPNSVTVITQQQIQAQNATSIDDAVRYAPGVTVSLANPNDTTYLVRGFPITSFQLDGVPTTIPQSGAAMVSDSLAMYDRVEVLRGPSGLFNGFGGDGGTINLVRKRAPSAFQAWADLSLGTYADKREQVDIGGPINDAGTLRGRVVAMQHDQHLMQDGAWQRDQQLYGTLEADLTSTTTARVGFSYTKEAGHVMYGLPTYTDYSTIVALPRNRYIGADWDHLSAERTNAFAEVEQKLGGGWVGKIAYNHVQADQHFLNGIPGSYVDPVTFDGNPYSYNYQDRNTQDAVDAYASGPFRLFGRKHNLTIGANYMHQSDHSTEYFINPNTGLDMWGDYYSSILDNSVYSDAFAGGPQNDYRTVTNQYGLYGNARFSLADPLTLVVGGRLTWWDNTLTPNSDPYYNQFGETYAKEKAGPKFTPFVGLVYDLNDTYSVYASYTSIYKPQTSYFSYTGDMIKPVTGDQYEVGLKGEYFGGKLNTSIALFQIDESNRAFSDPGHIGYYLAQGKARSQGVELTASGEVLSGLTLSAGYTYVDLRALDKSTTSTTPFSQTPRNQFKLWANYQLPGKLSQWNVGGGLYATGSTYFTDGTNNTYAPGYAVIDASIGYRFSRNLSTTLSVSNLFDRKYFLTAAGAAGNYYGNPRKILLSLHYKI